MGSGAVGFGHDGFSERVDKIGKSISWSSAAENVASNMGYSDPATVAVEGWIGSTDHRENMEGDYNLTRIGICKNDQTAYYYFTQIFVRTQ